jgi:hypothetical protein
MSKLPTATMRDGMTSGIMIPLSIWNSEKYHFLVSALESHCNIMMRTWHSLVFYKISKQFKPEERDFQRIWCTSTEIKEKSILMVLVSLFRSFIRYKNMFIHLYGRNIFNAFNWDENKAVNVCVEMLHK